MKTRRRRTNEKETTIMLEVLVRIETKGLPSPEV